MKQQLINLWRSEAFQIGMDVCRVMLIIMAVLTFSKLVTEIEAVKMLGYDPCALCMNKTGAVCFYPEQMTAINANPVFNYSEVNLSEILTPNSTNT